jgi:hypothetical protein
VAGTAKPLFVDSFESGDLRKDDESGFSWSGSSEGYVVRHQSASAVPDGEHTMVFTYNAGQEWKEKRFDLGKAYPDIWFRFWIRVPHNYEHTHPNASSNRKLFALWMDDYSNKGLGPTVLWEFWKDGAKGSRVTVHWSEGGYKSAGGHQQRQQFITYPKDLGRWMQLVFRVKAASSPTAKDGIVQMWRRWQGEEEFTQLHEITWANIAMPHTGPYGWTKGYLMGWANATYPERTEWHIDDFTISTRSLLEITSESKNPPAAPRLNIQGRGQ